MLYTILFRTVLFYFVVQIAYKIMGKRELGELGVFDFIISMLISNLIAISIENTDYKLIYSLLPIILLVFLEISLSYFSLKCFKFRKIFDGKESVIINDGKINFKEMQKQRYSLTDLLIQLREKSIKSLEDVEYAILETTGKLSVFEKKDKNKIFPLPIILDGQIEKDNLRFINKNEKWLKSILKNKKVLINEVFYAFYKDSDLFIIKKD